MKIQRISAFQLFTLAWIISLSEIIFQPCKIQNLSLFDTILSSLAVCFVILLLSMPILSLQGVLCDKNCYFETNHPTIKNIFYLLLTIFFLFSAGFTLSEFFIFLKNTFSFQAPAGLIAVLTAIAAFFVAKMGIEGISRATVICAFVIVASLITLAISLLPMVEKINFEPLFYDGGKSFTFGMFEILSRSSFLPVVVALTRYLNGKLTRGIAFCGLAIYGILSLILLLLCGVCGDFLSKEMFPLRVLVSIAKIGDFEHTDIIYISLWFIGIIVKTSLFTFFCSNYMTNLIKKSKMLSEKSDKFTTGVILASVCVMIYAIAMGFAENKFLIWHFDADFVAISLLMSMLVLGFMIPLFAWFRLIFLKKRGA